MSLWSSLWFEPILEVKAFPGKQLSMQIIRSWKKYDFNGAEHLIFILVLLCLNTTNLCVYCICQMVSDTKIEINSAACFFQSENLYSFLSLFLFLYKNERYKKGLYIQDPCKYFYMLNEPLVLLVITTISSCFLLSHSLSPTVWSETKKEGRHEKWETVFNSWTKIFCHFTVKHKTNK